MVEIRFTYYARHLGDGNPDIALYVKDMPPTEGETVYCERKSMGEAVKLIQDLVGDDDDQAKVGNDKMLFIWGDPPDGSLPIFGFSIGITWKRKEKTAHYTRIGYERFSMEGRWNPVASLGMAQFDYILGTVRKLEKQILAARSKPAMCA